MKTERRLLRSNRPPCLALLVGAIATGCGDSGPTDLEALPRREELYSLDRPDTNRPSAFDLYFGIGVVVESPGALGRWDFFIGTEGDDLVIGTASVLGIEADAGLIAIPDVRFAEVREAPLDPEAYTVRETIVLSRHNVYVLRSRTTFDDFAGACQVFGKLQPVHIDREREVVVFVWSAGLGCYDRVLAGPTS